jgi:glucose/arabinose dehydrogenase
MNLRSLAPAAALLAVVTIGSAVAWAAAPHFSPASATRVAQAGREQSLLLPPGFQIRTFASGLEAVRFMTVGPDGDLYATVPGQGKVVRLPDRNGDGSADEVIAYAEGLNRPHGLAFNGSYLYVGETDGLTRVADTDGNGRADLRERLAELPSGGGHWTRTVGFGPDGMLYVSIGSSCNVCEERDPRRAAIMQFAPDGSNGRIYARGLRNAVGFVFHPTSGELWAANNGRDMLGDDVPPETVNVVHDGDDFGWPRCINGTRPDPQFGGPGACDGVARPAVEMQAHSAPLGLAFYTGEQFPADYRGDLFVAFHGSWNRTEPTGYKVVRIPMRDGQPTGEVQDFITGWLQGGDDWGRPVDVQVAPDGGLYISDDGADRIYRVIYMGQ